LERDPNRSQARTIMGVLRRVQGRWAESQGERKRTDLSRIADIFVIARTPAFICKGKPVDVRQVARELCFR
jgi:TolB-like protein